MSNRRIRRTACFLGLSSLPIPASKTTFIASAHSAWAKYNWHLDQHRARKAKLDHRRGGDGWYRGTPASHAVSLPTDPLHTQWLSGTLTPWEYQHLVHRSPANATYEARWEQMEANLADNADDTGGVYPDHDHWIRVAESIEDDFLYRHLAPCGAD